MDKEVVLAILVPILPTITGFVVWFLKGYLSRRDRYHDIEKKIEKNNDKLDKLSDAFCIYVEANGSRPEIKKIIKDKLKRVDDDK